MPAKRTFIQMPIIYLYFSAVVCPLPLLFYSDLSSICTFLQLSNVYLCFKYMSIFYLFFSKAVYRPSALFQSCLWSTCTSPQLSIICSLTIYGTVLSVKYTKSLLAGSWGPSRGCPCLLHSISATLYPAKSRWPPRYFQTDDIAAQFAHVLAVSRYIP